MALRRQRIPLIEFLKERIYLGAFDEQPHDTARAVHFTIDDSLPYNPFHHDFGPLHIGHLYRFAVTLHEILGEEQNEGKAVVLYSRTNPRDRANAACVLACYMVLIQSWPPHLALVPLAQADPPFMPFRDAGYAPADFGISIQDVVYGVWRAKEQKLIDIRTFNLEEYELYERVDQGDFNEIAPHFVAFASPQQNDYEIARGEINYPFQMVLEYFESHDVKLVVRLNSHLYDKTEFEARGIKHVDLIFEDGTCPTMEFVQAFIGAVEGVIAEGGKVAVHCKAGLGRTGCLIGAHLIYTHGFTAQECIAYMRFLRPGMVVGPQQHWLYLHQHEFRDWKRTMTVSTTSSAKLAGYCPLVPRTYGSSRSPSSRRSEPRTPERNVLGEMNSNSALPVPTPGQPRKNSPTPGGRYSGGSGIAGARNINRSPAAKRYMAAASQNSDEECDSDATVDTTVVKQAASTNDRDSIYNDAGSDSVDGASAVADAAAASTEPLAADEEVFSNTPVGSPQDDEDDHVVATPSSKPANRSRRSGAITSATSPLQVSKRSASSANSGIKVVKSRQASARKVSGSGIGGGAGIPLFGDEENVDAELVTDGENGLVVAGGKPSRHMNGDSLTQTQLLAMQRSRHSRSSSNPGSRHASGAGGAKTRSPSYQVTTTTTTTTTTTMLSSSPPTTAAIKAVANKLMGGVAGTGPDSPVRRSNRIISSGVRKTSAAKR